MRILYRVLAAVLIGWLAAPAQAQIVERPIPGDPVQTDAGKVSGLILPSGVKAYLGLPFAAPPVRELRWRAPQAVKPWQGVFHADRKAPECIQVLRAHNINHYFGEEATSEDCLYLNIWAPATAKPGSRLPVIVYLYGGGNTIGSSGMALYGGEQVAASGAVFVNFNYRVGALGFMAHPQLTAESPQHSSGNYAHLDQIAALQWVHRNIARFGGDPSQVVISGQSAGAYSVSLLQATPLARGLFRGVLGMSGSTFGLERAAPPSLAEAEQVGLQVAAALKAADIEALRQMPADRILSVQQDCQLGCSGSIRIGGANIDGYLLPAAPAELFASGRHSDVPVIIGFTRDESSNDLRSARTVAQYNDAATRLYGAKAGELLRLYPAATDTDVAVQGASAAREGGTMTQAGRNWAIAQSRWSKAPAYLYQFSRVHPFNPAVVIADHPEAIGAYHTSDVPFWFQTQEALNLFRPTRLWSDADRQFARDMTASLMQFARTGNPSTTALPWQPWRADNERMLDLGRAVTASQLNTERLEFHRLNPANASTQTAPRGARD